MDENFDVYSALEGIKEPGERVIWYGKSKAFKLFGPEDFMLIPFSIFWFGFSLFWEFMALKNVVTQEGPLALKIIFPLFGLPFVLIGFFLMFGRYIIKLKNFYNMVYVLTSKRVMTVTVKGEKKTIAALDLDGLFVPKMTVGKDGMTGTITFMGRSSFNPQTRAEMIENFKNLKFAQHIEFSNIENPQNVYSQVEALMQKAKGPETGDLRTLLNKRDKDEEE